MVHCYFSACIASFFFITDIILNIALNFHKSPSFLKLALNMAIVSVVGSVVVIGGFLLGGLVLGYVPLKDISGELGGAIILGGIMVFSNFTCILPLRSIGLLLLKNCENSR
jgi:hypothetical protein